MILTASFTARGWDNGGWCLVCLSCFFEVAKPGVIVVAEPKEYGFLQFILYRLENIFLHIIVIKLRTNWPILCKCNHTVLSGYTWIELLMYSVGVRSLHTLTVGMNIMAIWGLLIVFELSFFLGWISIVWNPHRLKYIYIHSLKSFNKWCWRFYDFNLTRPGPVNFPLVIMSDYNC